LDGLLIAVLGEGNEDIAMLALKSGANDYLIKDRRQLQKLLPLSVNKAIEQKIQSDELQKYCTQLENIVEERTAELIDMYVKLQGGS
jgi:PleD family two-component response regulator